jgi:hypothetical protein
MMALGVVPLAGQAYRAPRGPGGKPDLNGIWQALNEANWDLEAHAARSGAVTQAGVYPFEYARVPAAPVVALGAAAGVPASLGVVQDDGKIPYKPELLATKNENVEHWIDRDPALKCYLPGTPRAMYLPYPFEITQSTNKVHVAFAFSNDNCPPHRHRVHRLPHRLRRNLIGHLAIALTHRACGFNGCNLDHAQHFEREIAFDVFPETLGLRFRLVLCGHCPSSTVFVRPLNISETACGGKVRKCSQPGISFLQWAL